MTLKAISLLGGMFLTPQVTKEMVEALRSPRILKTHSYYSDLEFDETFHNCKVMKTGIEI